MRKYAVRARKQRGSHGLAAAAHLLRRPKKDWCAATWIEHDRDQACWVYARYLEEPRKSKRHLRAHCCQSRRRLLLVPPTISSVSEQVACDEKMRKVKIMRHEMPGRKNGGGRGHEGVMQGGWEILQQESRMSWALYVTTTHIFGSNGSVWRTDTVNKSSAPRGRTSADRISGRSEEWKTQERMWKFA